MIQTEMCQGEQVVDACSGTHNDNNETSLLQAASVISGVSNSRIRQLISAAGLLNPDASPKQPWQGCSRLGAEGSPYQVCVSQAIDQPDQCIVRLLLDPGFDLAAKERLAHSLRLARAMARECGADECINHLEPFSQAPPVGALWLAWTLAEPVDCRKGVALYVNPEVFGGNDWDETAERLDRLLVPSSMRRKLIADVQVFCRPVSLALELQPQGVRVKLYLRNERGTVAQLAQALPEVSQLGLALELLCPTASWPATGLTFSVSFDPVSGAPDGCKLDFCLCPKCRVRAGVSSQLETDLCRIMPLATPLVEGATLALLGVAAGGKGARINAYFN